MYGGFNLETIKNDPRISKLQRKEVARWIAKHENPECKMNEVTYEVCDHGEFATCACGEILDLTIYG